MPPQSFRLSPKRQENIFKICSLSCKSAKNLFNGAFVCPPSGKSASFLKFNFKNDRNNKCFAFTLAEILITLVIIGVIAALTIPGVIESTHDKELVTALKKTYSDLSRGYTMALRENGMISTWGWTKDLAEDSDKFAEIMIPYFNLSNVCTSNESSCFTKINEYKRLDGKNWLETDSIKNGYSSATMANGQIILFELFQDCGEDRSDYFGSLPMNSTICGSIYVDINGEKKPNVIGKDVFRFMLSDYGVVPSGVANFDVSTKTSNSFANDCRMENEKRAGWSCTAWVIYNENMDYLKCSGLSWNGAHSCKEVSEENSNN